MAPIIRGVTNWPCGDAQPLRRPPCFPHAARPVFGSEPYRAYDSGGSLFEIFSRPRFVPRFAVTCLDCARHKFVTRQFCSFLFHARFLWQFADVVRIHLTVVILYVTITRDIFGNN